MVIIATIGIRLSMQEKESLAQIAKRTDTTISQIMRKLIREHLARDASQGVLSKSKEVRKEENVYE